MEKIYRVQMNNKGMPNFSTAIEVEPKQADNLISREDAIDALEKAKERYFDRAVVIARMQDILRAIPSAQPKQGEWIPCSEIPKTDRNVFIARGSEGFKSVCIGHYEHDIEMWYEDKNWFAKPLYDGLYWCEIPAFPEQTERSE